MSRPWQTLDRRETADGVFELRQRGVDDFLIAFDGRVLMNSRQSLSEKQLGSRSCEGIKQAGRVLVGGLGMGLTLRAVLDSLDSEGRVIVAELHSVVVDWCRGPLADLSQGCLADSRVTVQIGDVTERIREAADDRRESYDAIVLDLFEGPHARTTAKSDPLYGSRALERCWRALSRGGVLGVWAEAREESFESRLRAQGFSVVTHRPGRGGLRHWIVLARKTEHKK